MPSPQTSLEGGRLGSCRAGVLALILGATYPQVKVAVSNLRPSRLGIHTFLAALEDEKAQEHAALPVERINRPVLL